MTPEILRHLSRYPSFPKAATDLMRVIGEDCTARLISAWGGQEFRIPSVVGGGDLRGVRRYRMLVATLGELPAVSLVKEFGGDILDIPNLRAVEQQFRRDQIIDEFDRLTGTDGLSGREAVFELGIRYGLTGRAIEQTLKKPHSGVSSNNSDEGGAVVTPHQAHEPSKTLPPDQLITSFSSRSMDHEFN